MPRLRMLAKAGLRAFVISGNLGLPDGNARYNLPPRRSRTGSASVKRALPAACCESQRWTNADPTGSAARRN